MIDLEGLVEPGTIHATRAGVDFVVTSGATHLQVDNAHAPAAPLWPPFAELFQPNIPVIAVGHFAAGIFESNQILVKHTT